VVIGGLPDPYYRGFQGLHKSSVSLSKIVLDFPVIFGIIHPYD